MTVEDQSLLQPPLNVLRVSLHPRGVAPRIANLAEWRAHVLERLRKQIDASGDAVLIALLEELRAYPAPAESPAHRVRDYAGVVVPIELITDQGICAFFSTTTIFGTLVDVTLSELAVEAFFPTDEKTAQMLGGRASSPPPPGIVPGGESKPRT